MATKQEVKNKFIQSLIDTVLTDGNVNLDSYRRHVGADGQFTTAPLEDSNQQIILYNDDSQLHSSFYDDVDDIIECLADGSGGYNHFTMDMLYQTDNLYWYCSDATAGTTDQVNYDFGSDCISNCTDEGDYCIPETFGDQSGPIIYFDIYDPVMCGPNYISVNDEVLSILSQLVGFNTSYTEINPNKAKEVLDTEIFELIPKSKTRQQEIDNFFASYHRLKGELPAWDDDFDNDGTPDHFLDPVDETNYTTNHDITTNPDGSIVRLSSDSTEVNPTEKTLEGLRLDLDTFLRDIDTPLETQGEDERPTYEHKSPGHIKIRHLNQAIIVRNKEGNDIGIMGDSPDYKTNPKFLTDGFTITMWVKFLDKVSGGTLFNFGNPLRENNPFGFTLETFVVNKEDYGDIPNFEDSGFFSNGDQERFVRLVVNDTGNVIRDSHVGMDFGQSDDDDYGDRLDTGTETEGRPALEYNSKYAFNYTHIPVDLNEWYFIVANFNTGVDEDASHDDGADTNSDYWKWNWNGSSYTHFSGLGAKCKVEIISKSDLIRARGFKLEKS